MVILLQIVNSMPPIWGMKAPYGSLGTFYGTDQIAITLSAMFALPKTRAHSCKVSHNIFYSLCKRGCGRG